MYYPTLEQARAYLGQGNLLPVYREVMADLETPVSAYLKIDDGGYSFLLESVEGGQRLARYSFLGVRPYLVITSRHYGPDPLEEIALEMAKLKVVPISGLPRFSGGAVGYLAYEEAARMENIPIPEADTLGLPGAVFMLAETLLIFDHVTHRIKVLSHMRLDGDIEAEYNLATGRIDALVKRLCSPLPPADRVVSKLAPSPDVISNVSRQDFEAAVEKARTYITAGEAIQVVLSQCLSGHTHASPFSIYRALRSINPSPYMFYLNLKDFQLVGASPEILVRVEGGQVMTRPLAGTRPRGKTPADDARLEMELRNDEKERAEHIMLVDLGRNDIGRVSQPGSVEVSDLMEVERYSHVMHLVSHVQGKIRPDYTAFDALRACFPAGTVSGAPKVRAMQIIAELEGQRRGPYAGAVGYLSFSGNMDMAITIRTAVVKDSQVHVQAGCGVVYDSVPGNEYQETLNKARAMLKAIRQAEESGEVTHAALAG
jgi:anthranilate synthase component 1